MEKPPMLPKFALSIRQTWAWAIVAGHKDVENRSRVAMRKGHLDFAGFFAIHAAKTMTKYEYEFAFKFMERRGVQCPAPAGLTRGAIIGGARVVGLVSRYDSPWFTGPIGLVLTEAFRIDPIPALGALGHFEWRPGGILEEPRPWMQTWPLSSRSPRQEQQDEEPVQLSLFPERAS